MLTEYKVCLTEKKRLVSDVFLFRFSCREPKEIRFEPGQYLILKVKGKPRLYSIASSAKERGGFELLVKLVKGGLASGYLKRLKIGDQVVFQGAAGLFKWRPTNKTKIFLATGTGLAPIRSMLKSNLQGDGLKPKTKCFLFWGLRRFSGVYLFEELTRLRSKTKGQFKFKICLSREKSLKKIPQRERKFFYLGHIDYGFDKEFGDLTKEELKAFEFYICGSRQVVEALRGYLYAKGIEKKKVFFERF